MGGWRGSRPTSVQYFVGLPENSGRVSYCCNGSSSVGVTAWEFAGS
jgi:hypothetical protein